MLNSPALLLIQNDVAAGHEAAFDQWYLDEHLPERLAVPGFRRGRRWRAAIGRPRDLTCYEIDDVAVMRSPAYLARTAAPTERTQRIMGAFVGMRRSVCRVEHARGVADGGAAAVMPFAALDDPARLLAALASEAGVLAVAIVTCDQAASQSDSVESRLRGTPDATIDQVVWLEATTPELAAAALERHRWPQAGAVAAYALVAEFTPP